MNIIKRIKEEAKKNQKKILLNEVDKRIFEAIKIVNKEKFCKISLVGNKKEIEKYITDNNIKIKNLDIIDPNEFNDIDNIINEYYELRKNKGITIEDAKKNILENTMNFSCMLVKLGYFDGLVSGLTHTSSDTIRPALQIIKAKEGFASSFFLMDTKQLGPVIYSDCGMIQNPTSIELSKITNQACKNYRMLTNKKENCVLLSHSTMGSSICDDSKKVVEALNLIKENYKDLNVDGEMQFDAAIDLEVAKIKAPNSTIAGHANVFIFPDLDSGNIAYKITERLGKAKAYGPIIQGLNKPVNDLSRGSNVDDIIGVIAITALQANDK